MTWIEAVATFFGILCVWLTIRQNVLCWPTGVIQVFLYIFIFYHAKLYADMVLHIIYVGVSVYGWIHWSARRDSVLSVTLTRKMPVCIVALAIGTIVWGYSLATFTDASIPYPDSFVVTASLIAQWLTTRKKLESWYFWIAADVIAIIVYAYKDLYFTAGLYFIFTLMAIAGYRVWLQSLQKSANQPIVAS